MMNRDAQRFLRFAIGIRVLARVAVLGRCIDCSLSAEKIVCEIPIDILRILIARVKQLLIHWHGSRPTKKAPRMAQEAYKLNRTLLTFLLETRATSAGLSNEFLLAIAQFELRPMKSNAAGSAR